MRLPAQSVVSHNEPMHNMSHITHPFELLNLMFIWLHPYQVELRCVTLQYYLVSTLVSVAMALALSPAVAEIEMCEEALEPRTSGTWNFLGPSGWVQLSVDPSGSTTSYVPLIIFISYFNHHCYHAFSHPPSMCTCSLDFYATCKFSTLHVSHEY
jgi:hypothetical protein